MLKGQCVSVKAVQMLVNSSDILMSSSTGIQHLMTAQSFILSQGNFSMQNGYGYKCLSVIDRAEKVIQGSSEVLVNNIPQIHHWVNFVPFQQTCYYYFHHSPTIVTRKFKFPFAQLSIYQVSNQPHMSFYTLTSVCCSNNKQRSIVQYIASYSS